MQEFLNVAKTRKFVHVEKKYYRFDDGYIYVGEEPFSFWVKVHPRTSLSFYAYSIGKPKQDLKIFFEPYEQEEKMIRNECLNRKFLFDNYRDFDYTDLFTPPKNKNETGLMTEIDENVPFYNFNGTDYINLINNITIFW
uniref:Uncharacterized protein n=1 Tax=Panagrolaimus sp. PS1159 TaxID=55785 RepID=A0AC35FFW6_9BILA